MEPPEGFDAFASGLTPDNSVKALGFLIDRLPVLQDWPERVAGIPVGAIGGRPVFMPIEGHSITVGATGEGKFTSAIAPLALHDVRDERGLGCGMVFVDPKNGEAARITGPYRAHMREELTFVIDPYGKAGGADTLNPFDFLYPEDDDFFEQCSGLAKALVVQRPKEKRGTDFIWDSRGAEWLRAVIGYLAREADEERTIMRIRQIFSADADSFASVLARMQMQPGAPAFIVNSATDMQRVTGKAEREASGYIATIMEATQFADSLRMTGVLANSTFDPIAIRRDGASVYIVTADERLETSAPWVRLVCEVVRQRINRSPVHRQVHWVIDEAKAFDAWSFIEEGLRAMRSANISLHLFYQNVGQLKGVWGEGWTSIADTKVIRFLGSSDVETCKWIAELAGETTVVEYGVSDNTSETRGDLHARGQTAGEADADGTSRTSNWSVAKGLSHGQSHSRALANAETWGQQRNRSRTNSLSRSEGSSFGQSHAITHGHSFQESTSTSTTHGDSLSFGAGPGGSTSNTGIHSSTTTNASSSTSESTSVTNGVNSSVSTNHGSSESDTTGESDLHRRQPQSDNNGGRHEHHQHYRHGRQKHRTHDHADAEQRYIRDADHERITHRRQNPELHRATPPDDSR